MTTVSIGLNNPAQANAAINDLWRLTIKPHAQRGGASILTWTTTDRYYRHQMRKGYHGHFLNTVAESIPVFCPIEGRRARRAPAVWKDLFRMYVPPTFEEVSEGGIVLVKERRRSTEELSDDDFAEFYTRCQAHVALEHGLVYEGEL